MFLFSVSCLAVMLLLEWTFNCLLNGFIVPLDVDGVVTFLQQILILLPFFFKKLLVQDSVRAALYGFLELLKWTSLLEIWYIILDFLKNLIGMGSSKQSARILDTLKMERVRTILTHTYPYPHEHSRHAVIAVVIGCLFFISSDNIHTLVEKLDNNVKWWSMYACLFGFFYFFSSPFIHKTFKPSYSNFSRWWVSLVNVLPFMCICYCVYLWNIL